MKKQIIIFGLISVLFAWSCTDLEEEPQGTLSPEGLFATSVEALEAAVIGSLSEYSAPQMYGRQIIVAIMLKSDMIAIGAPTAADRHSIDDMEANSENSLVGDAWKYYYRSISAANTAIQGSQIINADPEVVLPLEAEARFIRAFGYYNLVRLFGDVPYLDSPVESRDQVTNATRTPVATIYDNIIDDLIFAKDNLPDQREGEVRNRPTAGAAATVLAEVYLTMGQYSNAYTEAKSIIDNRASYNFDLQANYAELYDGDLHRNAVTSMIEPIFVVDFHNTTDDRDNNIDWLLPFTKIRGTGPRKLSVLVPEQTIYDTWDAGDYRRAVSFIDTYDSDGDGIDDLAIDDPSSTAVIQRPHIAKYNRTPGPQDGGDDRRGDQDYLLYRYADVLLIAAEAIAEGGGGSDAEARGYINALRARARATDGSSTNAVPADDTSSSGQALIDVVREERRLELCFEFKRWFDIKRWVENGGASLSDFYGSGSGQLEDRSVDASDLLFQIPQVEIDVAGLEQNP